MTRNTRLRPARAGLSLVPLAATLAIASLGTLTGCTTPAPPSPAVAAQEHMYEMGCRPVDRPIDGGDPYCGNGGGGGGKQ
jgi:hypothetical protein